MLIRVCRYKNASVAGYAEAFRSVQSDSPTSNWYSYFENNVLVIYHLIERNILTESNKSPGSISKSNNQGNLLASGEVQAPSDKMRSTYSVMSK